MQARGRTTDVVSENLRSHVLAGRQICLLPRCNSSDANITNRTRRKLTKTIKMGDALHDEKHGKKFKKRETGS
ncbi:hypothetical protein J6590_055410 [Homalodisca vitripennis]|nr:hypothetical protein J6590_055410 [Homalodisca vitripennis]